MSFGARGWPLVITAACVSPMKGKVYTKAPRFIHSLSQYLFSAYYGPGTALGTRHEVVN